jgi:outer membrane protein TolC
MMNKILPRLAPAAALVLAGCASFSDDGGLGDVSRLTQERTGQAVSWPREGPESDATRARIADLLRQPLTAESAVEVALLNNRGLRARLAGLGVAEADLVRAGRLANPSFSFGRVAGGGTAEIDRSVMFNLLGLLSLPVARQVEQQRFERAQLEAADQAVALAAQTRQAWFSAVAAQQLVTYAGQVQQAADAAGELAVRLQQVGNFSKLAQMRQQAFQADAAAQMARARHQATAERERLVRLLGLAGDQLGFQLAERLPDLPAQPLDARDAEQTAMDRRLDVQMARRETAATARALGLTQATRFINVLHAGYASKSATGEARQEGYEIELELPLFDFGATRNARAEALYLQSVHRTAEIAVNARSEVREAWSAYRTAYDLARHYRDEVVPLKQRISEESLLRYNGMLISVFDLLADSRDQVLGVTAAIEALRDHWIAQTRLQTALTGRSPGALALPTGGTPSTGPADAGH